MRQHRPSLLLLVAFPLAALAPLFFPATGAFAHTLSTAPYLTRFHTISVLASTVPANGDVNPYGVAVVPRTVGALVAGAVLVSNFNNAANAQGAGSTIVQVTPAGAVSQFAHISLSDSACPGGVGLTTALGVLQRGWVIVGSLPTTDGTAATTGRGCLIVLDSTGHVAATLADANINGPWDMTLVDSDSSATIFVTNVLNGTVAAKGAVVDGGTILRIALSVPAQGGGTPSKLQETVVGSDFPERTDPAALVIGPTGLALSGSTLYVADSLDNRIAAIANAPTASASAGIGQDVSVGGALDDPLGMTLAPNGNLVSVNGNDGKAVEVTPAGAQVAVKVLDNTVTAGGKNGGGALFGLAPAPEGGGLYFVDDDTNTLNLLHSAIGGTRQGPSRKASSRAGHASATHGALPRRAGASRTVLPACVSGGGTRRCARACPRLERRRQGAIIRRFGRLLASPSRHVRHVLRGHPLRAAARAFGCGPTECALVLQARQARTRPFELKHASASATARRPCAASSMRCLSSANRRDSSGARNAPSTPPPYRPLLPIARSPRALPSNRWIATLSSLCCSWR